MDDNRVQIEEIKERVDIVNEISKYVELKQAGKNYSGLCPFHKEKTPSFIVSPEIQRFKCFGCGKTGDVFNFVQDIENIDFPETLERLAKIAGVELKKPQQNSYSSKLLEINKLAAQYFYKQLKKDKEALAYVRSRGFDDETIFKFGIGYAPGSYKLLEYIQSGETKFNKKQLLDSGLFVEREGKLRGKFFKRIMFPLRSSSGKIVGFSGRIMPNYDKGPKYMNTPETPIFHKKENVFGQYESRQAIRKNDLVILCEGQTDVISSHQAGVENIVAPLGTAITKEQLEKLSKMTQNYLFIFDSDLAGQSAMQRAFILCSQLDLNAFGVSPEPYKDIDEMIQDDKKKFKSLTKKKVDLFTFLFSKFIEKKDPNTYTDYVATTKWIKEMLKHVTNPNKKKFYINVINSSYFFGSNDEFGSKNEGSKNLDIKADFENTKLKNREDAFIAALIGSSFHAVPSNINLSLFNNEIHVKLIKFVLGNTNITNNSLLENPEFREVVENAIFNFSQLEEEENIENLYSLLEKDYYDRELDKLKRQISLAEKQKKSKESERLLKEFLKLKKLADEKRSNKL